MDAELGGVPAPLATLSTETMAGLLPWGRRAEAVVREAVRCKKTGSRISLRDETAIALVIDGLRTASRSAGVSGRTLRRRFVRDGATISAFVTDVRLQAARDLYAMGWTTDRAAAALGYSSAAAFRRFLRRSSGQGIWSLRKAPRCPR